MNPQIIVIRGRHGISLEPGHYFPGIPYSVGRRRPKRDTSVTRDVRVDPIGDTEDWAFLRGKDEMMSLDDGEFSPP